MGYLRNLARGVGRVVARETKRSAKKTLHKTGNRLFGNTYSSVAKKRRSATAPARKRGRR